MCVSFGWPGCGVHTLPAGTAPSWRDLPNCESCGRHYLPQHPRYRDALHRRDQLRRDMAVQATRQGAA